ncbi:hypothetical protein [Candidatus Pelagibacter sp.]|uniref:hypothetical protein n=1 Tax=Candidatus Pelagibacter sp. TaxID=2024849 RepID=UPI003F865D2C
MYYKIEEYVNVLNRHTNVCRANNKDDALTKFNTFSAEYVGVDSHLQTQQQQVIVTPISNQQYKQMRGNKR